MDRNKRKLPPKKADGAKKEYLRNFATESGKPPTGRCPEIGISRVQPKTMTPIPPLSMNSESPGRGRVPVPTPKTPSSPWIKFLSAKDLQIGLPKLSPAAMSKVFKSPMRSSPVTPDGLFKKNLQENGATPGASTSAVALGDKKTPARATSTSTRATRMKVKKNLQDNFDEEKEEEKEAFKEDVKEVKVDKSTKESKTEKVNTEIVENSVEIQQENIENKEPMKKRKTADKKKKDIKEDKQVTARTRRNNKTDEFRGFDSESDSQTIQSQKNGIPVHSSQERAQKTKTLPKSKQITKLLLTKEPSIISSTDDEDFLPLSTLVKNSQKQVKSSSPSSNNSPKNLKVAPECPVLTFQESKVKTTQKKAITPNDSSDDEVIPVVSKNSTRTTSVKNSQKDVKSSLQSGNNSSKTRKKAIILSDSSDEEIVSIASKISTTTKQDISPDCPVLLPQVAPAPKKTIFRNLSLSLKRTPPMQTTPITIHDSSDDEGFNSMYRNKKRAKFIRCDTRTSNTDSIPDDVMDNLAVETMRNEVASLQKQIKGKQFKVNGLKQAVIYKTKHNVDDVNKFTQVWKGGCEQALNALHERLKQCQEHFSMEELMQKMNLPKGIITFDPVNNCFV